MENEEMTKPQIEKSIKTLLHDNELDMAWIGLSLDTSSTAFLIDRVNTRNQEIAELEKKLKAKEENEE